MNTTTELLTERIDRELRARGMTLAAWAADRGLTPVMLVWMVEGRRPLDEGVALDLQELLGPEFRQIAA